jgi:hypothetical protein
MLTIANAVWTVHGYNALLTKAARQAWIFSISSMKITDDQVIFRK